MIKIGAKVVSQKGRGLWTQSCSGSKADFTTRRSTQPHQRLRRVGEPPSRLAARS